MEISRYNCKPVNFQGIYITKGSVKDLKKFKDLMLNTCYDLTNMKIKNPDKFWNHTYQALIPVYSQEQKFSEYLIVTNDDTEKLLMFWASKPKSELSRINSNTSINEAMKILDKDMHRIGNKIQQYNSAVKNGENALSDFLIDAYQKGRKILAEILGADDAAKVKTLDVKVALEAAQNGKFDFVEGKILE